MADNSTIGVDLGGMITTSGGESSAVLQSLAAFIVAQDYTFEPAPKSSFPLPAGVFGTLTGDPVVALDSNSAGVNTAGFNATITGGGPTTAVLAPGGSLDYSGGAGHLFANLGSGTIDSSAAAATVAAVDGTYLVAGIGADSYLLGGAGAVTASSGGSSSATLQGGVSYTAGANDTIAATAGTSTVIGAAGDVYTGNAASVLFVGTATANTVFGGTGADTVYGDGTTFVGGSGNKVFAGDTASNAATTASTVYGGSGAATVQAGAHGDLVYLQSAADRVVSGGGRDTIWGQASGGIAPTIFGTTNSYELMVSNMKGGLAIGIGDNTTLDGANTTGGLTYFANPGDGNQTFYGSVSGNDAFSIGTQNVGTSLIEIHDWHTGDTLNLSAFGAADQANALKVLSGGGSLFKLSDGTTVSFIGSHPTGGSGGFLT
jgi:Ca2+-binding RTX toxin-like protein